MTDLSNAYANAVNGAARSRGVRLLPLVPTKDERPYRGTAFGHLVAVLIGACIAFALVAAGL